MLRCPHLFSLAYTLFNVLAITCAPSTTKPFAVSLTYSNPHTLSLTRSNQLHEIDCDTEDTFETPMTLCKISSLSP